MTSPVTFSMTTASAFQYIGFLTRVWYSFSTTSPSTKAPFETMFPGAVQSLPWASMVARCAGNRVA